MNYYPFHIGDYLSATRHLSWEEDVAYRRLLDTCYMTERPLPLDERAVCRLVLATTDAQREAVRVVLAEFFVQTPEGWANRRAHAEIVVMREKQFKQRDRANKRWHQPGGMGDGLDGLDARGANGANGGLDARDARDARDASDVRDPVDVREGDLFDEGQPPTMTWERRTDAAACENDAAASKNDAAAMPPVPAPAPTPTPGPGPGPGPGPTPGPTPSPGGEGEAAAAAAIIIATGKPPEVPKAPEAPKVAKVAKVSNPPKAAPQRSRTAAPAAERPDDVPEPVWEDFLRLRREKRAPLTDTALAGIRREAGRAGLPLAQALACCCEQGWQGFAAGWYARRMGPGQGRPGGRAGPAGPVNRQEALEQRNRAVADGWVPPELRGTQQGMPHGMPNGAPHGMPQQHQPVREGVH